MWQSAVALVAAYLCAVSASDEGQFKIFGGSMAAEGEFPFLVSVVTIYNDGTTNSEILNFCGGIILSASWVLTAASCAEYSVNMIFVGYGSNYSPLPLPMSKGFRNHEMMIQNVTEKVVHEEFESTSNFFKNNIALLKVRYPFPLDGKKTAAAVLADFGELLPSSHGLIIGWGSFALKYKIENDLRKLDVLSFDCNYTINAHIPMVCAQGQPSRGVCRGDAGGPLIVGGKVFGVASMLAPAKRIDIQDWECDNDLLIGYYEAIAPQRKWIEKYTQV